MLQKGLVPLGFRESLIQVTRMCTFLKKLGTREVLLLHVGSNRGKTGRRNQQRMDEYADAVQQLGIRTNIAIQPGPIQKKVFSAAEETNPDYISLFFIKKSWITRTILGSHVKDIIRLSDLPVFVYKDTKRSETPDDTFRLLYATSLQGRDDAILSYIRDADLHTDEVLFLYAGHRAPDPSAEQNRKEKAERELKEAMKKCGLHEHQHRYITVIGSPRRQIVKTARKFPSNLLLLGKADTAAGREPVLGSTAEEVSYRSPCSVLIIPKEGKSIS